MSGCSAPTSTHAASRLGHDQEPDRARPSVVGPSSVGAGRLLGSPAAMPGTRLMAIMNRLEAATSRLEDMTQSTVDSVVTLNGMPFDPATTPKGLSVAAAAGRDGQGPPPPPPSLGPALSLPVSIKAFDDLINHDVAKFVKLGEDLGGVVAEQVRLRQVGPPSVRG